mgnify:FL=1
MKNQLIQNFKDALVELDLAALEHLMVLENSVNEWEIQDSEIIYFNKVLNILLRSTTPVSDTTKISQ